MANYKRKRPRTSARVNRPRNMQSWPRYWDVIFHRRPRRRRDAELTRAVLRGVIDPDDTAWSVDKKPHNYYW